MITYEVTFQDGKTLLLGPFPGRNEIIEKMLDCTLSSGMATDWWITRQQEEKGGNGKEMEAAESVQKSFEYLKRRRFQKNQDRKFRKTLAVVLVAGGILAAVVWRILF